MALVRTPSIIVIFVYCMILLVRLVRMIPLIDQHLKELEVLCERYRVRRLELFGSAATDRFCTQTSDLDFLVEFHALRPGQHADAYFGLLHELETLFGCPVDLVMTGAIQNRYFLEAIATTRTLLYAA